MALCVRPSHQTSLSAAVIFESGPPSVRALVSIDRVRSSRPTPTLPFLPVAHEHVRHAVAKPLHSRAARIALICCGGIPRAALARTSSFLSVGVTHKRAPPPTTPRRPRSNRSTSQTRPRTVPSLPGPETREAHARPSQVGAGRSAGGGGWFWGVLVLHIEVRA